MTLSEIKDKKVKVIDEYDTELDALDMEYDEKLQAIEDEYDKKVEELNSWITGEIAKASEKKDKEIEKLNKAESDILDIEIANKKKEYDKVQQAYDEYAKIRDNYNDKYGTVFSIKEDDEDGGYWLIDLVKEFL